MMSDHSILLCSQSNSRTHPCHVWINNEVHLPLGHGESIALVLFDLSAAFDTNLTLLTTNPGLVLVELFSNG